MQHIAPKDRIIVALDTPDLNTVEEIVHDLADHVGMVKVGKELFTAHGPKTFQTIHHASASADHGSMRTMCDLKYHDTPQTVQNAVRAAAPLRPSLLTLHTGGGRHMLEAALQGRKEAGAEGDMRLLGVTILTSLTYDDLEKTGGVPSREDLKKITDQSPEEYLRALVLKRARLAQSVGLDGIVASPQEATEIRAVCGPNFLIVTPGIRFPDAALQDQKRVGAPDQAIRDGADYLVIGRPITQAPDRVAATRLFADAIASAI